MQLHARPPMTPLPGVLDERLGRPTLAPFEALQGLGRGIALFDPVDTGAWRAIAHRLDHPRHLPFITLQMGLDSAIGQGADPAIARFPPSSRGRIRPGPCRAG